ncbi:MAG: VOC family protein [Verrucomicrobia bacterium]|nr:VOC family protein [Verrucomicrobiota bacterium]
MNTSSLGFRRVRVVALSVRDLERANTFYGETLALQPAYEDSKMIGYSLDETILMLKDDLGSPTETPNPRVTLETEDARATEKELRARGVVISDPVAVYDETHWVGSFLDTEGNKLWFCSYTQ